jgi:hypoxanthine phosphoribosyltransferase
MKPSRSSFPASRTAVPVRWRAGIERVLIPETHIARRVRELARAIQRDYSGRDLVVVSLLNGTVLFLADLIRHLSLPLRLDFIGVSSYRSGTRPGPLVFTKDLRLDVRNRDVLLVDDILDTGRTLASVITRLRNLRPRCLRVCVFLEKQVARVEPVAADYVGFTIPDEFVVGYGLDYAEHFRNLPFVGVLRRSQYEVASGVASHTKAPRRNRDGRRASAIT